MNPKIRTDHAGLAGKPGRRSRENVALQAQLLVLPPQPGQFLAFGRAQAGIGGRLCLPAPVLTVGLGNPVADRLGRGFEFASQIGRITPGTHQLDHLPPELRRIGGMGLGHKRDTSRKSFVGVHQTGANSQLRPSYCHAVLAHSVRFDLDGNPTDQPIDEDTRTQAKARLATLANRHRRPAPHKPPGGGSGAAKLPDLGRRGPHQGTGAGGALTLVRCSSVEQGWVNTP